MQRLPDAAGEGLVLAKVIGFQAMDLAAAAQLTDKEEGEASSFT